MTAGTPTRAAEWWQRGVTLHQAQQHEQALHAIEQAVALDPQPQYLLGRAQLRFETGRPAAADFAEVQALWPADSRVRCNWSAALAAEGQLAQAERVLTDALEIDPAWAEGIEALATLRQTAGHADFAAGHAEAVRRVPDQPGLRLAWFHALAKAKQWDAAGEVIEAALAHFGAQPAFQRARLYLLAESGQADGQPDLFDALADSTDPGVGLARVRHALRTGQAGRAITLAERFIGTPAAAMFWPYLSLAWRLLQDRRADWLDRPDRFVRQVPLGLSPGELDDLTAVLRGLHARAGAYHGQSVRGGTQTDRPLLFRHEPVIARVRNAILQAVQRYVDDLPPSEAGHPLLAARRDPLRLAGSWSVRLTDGGHHAAHTHPMGWISSACHLVLPQAGELPPAGWLRVGTPPPELRLGLPPYACIEPRVGQLVLFPSTLWHDTAPFGTGERLTLAFDLQRLALAPDGPAPRSPPQ